MDFNGDEIDQNLYLGLSPLLPNPSWRRNLDLPINPFSPSTQPSFMEEDPSGPLITSIDPVLLPIPNYTIYGNPNSAPQALNPSPSSSSANATLVQSRDEFSTILPNHLRDDVPGLPTMLIPLEDLVISRSRVPWVSARDRYQECPQLRFQRLLEVNRNRAIRDLHHSDTSPETLMNNILALESSRKERLKNGKGLGTTSTEKSGERTCRCGGNFECNICFETSMEPVVTPCGHLFCWRCLYKWMRTQMLSISECPVCKGEVTEGSLTPIYGRGGSSSAPDSVPGGAMEEIPPRPSGHRTNSTRQLMRQERNRGPGFASQEVERVRMDLEAVLARLRQVPRSNRGGTIGDGSGTVQVLPAGLATANGTGLVAGQAPEAGRGEGRGEGDEVDSGDVRAAGGEVHVRRRRRYR